MFQLTDDYTCPCCEELVNGIRQQITYEHWYEICHGCQGEFFTGCCHACKCEDDDLWYCCEECK